MIPAQCTSTSTSSRRILHDTKRARAHRRNSGPFAHPNTVHPRHTLATPLDAVCSHRLLSCVDRALWAQSAGSWWWRVSGKEVSKVMFCRACGFRVRVWESCRTSTSFGYGYESVTEPPEVSGTVARAYRTHISSGRIRKVLYPYPGYCGTGCTKLTAVPGTGMNVLQN